MSLGLEKPLKKRGAVAGPVLVHPPDVARSTLPALTVDAAA